MSQFQSVAEDCSVGINRDHELFAESKRKKNLEWDGQTMKSVRTDRDGGVGFRVLDDEKIGLAYANTSEIDPTWLQEQAESNRRLLSGDEYQSLTNADPSGDISDEWLDSTVREELPPRKERVTSAIDRRLNDDDFLKNLQVEYEERLHRFELYRNGKLISGETRSSFGISSWAVCESDEDVQSGFQQQTSYRYEDLDLDRVLREATEFGRRKLGAQPPESRTGPVLLNPRGASGLLRLVRSMVDGESVARGRSAWGPDTVGDTVADETVTVTDDPARKAGAANRTYDAEGHELDRINLIENGDCEGFLTNQYVADRLELENNHRASRSFTSRPNVSSTNFYLQPGEKSHSELEDSLGSGPVVTSIQPGSGLDSVAGQFSVGASGYFVESGSVAEPFDEATLSGSVDDLLKGVTGIGDNPPQGYSLASPSLLIEELSLGGS